MALSIAELVFAFGALTPSSSQNSALVGWLRFDSLITLSLSVIVYFAIHFTEPSCQKFGEEPSGMAGHWHAAGDLSLMNIFQGVVPGFPFGIFCMVAAMV